MRLRGEGNGSKHGVEGKGRGCPQLALNCSRPPRQRQTDGIDEVDGRKHVEREGTAEEAVE